MITKLHWEEFQHPFALSNSPTSLKITFHKAGLMDLSTKEKQALDVIKLLCNIDAIEPLYTEGDGYPCIKLENTANTNAFNVTVMKDITAPALHTWVSNVESIKRTASILFYADYHKRNVDEKTIFADLIFAEAHKEVHSNILITSAPWLVDQTDSNRANARLPTEAAQIIGLYLRSIGEFRIHDKHGVFLRVSPDMFYWALARSKLSNLWKYISACVQSSKTRNDDTDQLGFSIIHRCSHALQARDKLGKLFYNGEEYSADELMYHFNYVPLLLAGAIDAQLRISCRAYKLDRTEKNASYRNPNFIEKLSDKEANSLADFLSSEKIKATLDLIYDIRNTIHGAWIPGYKEISFQEAPKIVLELKGKALKDIYPNAEALGSPSVWGLRKEDYYLEEMKPENKRTRIELEPFSYCCKLLTEGFQIINQIAQKTEVERLFDEHKVPVLTDEPSDDLVFSKEVQNFLNLIG